MSRFTLDPVRQARVRAEQEELRRQYATHITMARLCPYCEHKVEVLCKGSHGASFVKCPKCNESVFFPPVVFRTLHRNNCGLPYFSLPMISA